jgi:hypothetical protein
MNRALQTAAATAAAVIALCATGCGDSAEPTQATTVTSSAAPDPAQSYERTQYTTVWSDTSGLDLTSPAGTYVRASVESLSVSAANGRRDAAAGGFWDTLTGPARADSDRFFALGPADPEFGVRRYEILDAVENGPTMTVTVCSYDDQIGYRVDDPAGDYRFRGIASGQRLTVDRTGGVAPPAPQQGPRNFPTGAVFGSWRTTAWTTTLLPTEDPCQGRRAPGLAPDWPTLGGGEFITDAVPAAPSSPGWPDGSDA